MICHSFVRVWHKAKSDRSSRAVAQARPARPYPTRAVLLFLSFFVFAVLGAACQDQPITLYSQAPSGTTTLPHVPYAGYAPEEWQVSAGYQYNRINIRGAFLPFNTGGPNLSVVRYFGTVAGIEGDAGAGIGSATEAVAWSLFVGGGPHLVYRNHTRFKPWIHGLAGVEHFAFGAAPSNVNSTSFAWIVGGGVDYALSPSFSVRAQGDYLGTFFGSAYQRNLQIVVGFVWNF
jgi:hypothetical protein